MSAAGGLTYDRYFLDGRAEWLMRIGPALGEPILIIAPLFEEMNRTRALLASVMRELGRRGFCCWLPDLPGTGESERPLADCGWEDWTGAVHHVAAQARAFTGRLTVASFRGGTLLDDVPDARCWRFALVEGAALLRDLVRAGLVAGESGAGYPLSEHLAASLAGAKPDSRPTCRTVRLASDPKSADAKLDGPALWRRSEPGNSHELASLIASDIGDWVATCGA